MNLGCVYVIQGAERGPLKIGHSNDPDIRLSQLQTGHHEELRVVEQFTASRDIEGRIHEALVQRLIRGEWFEDCDETRAVLVEAREWASEEITRRLCLNICHQLWEGFEAGLVPVIREALSVQTLCDVEQMGDQFAAVGRDLGLSFPRMLEEAARGYIDVINAGAAV